MENRFTLRDINVADKLLKTTLFPLNHLFYYEYSMHQNYVMLLDIDCEHSLILI